ncbi:MAG TPA: ABC transporter ATP-binding protein [Bacilli bacterium]|jgi:ATP-binding cassette subfamily B protein|nr:ABC transporter ATP-binding protein [Acholeplasmataceae bacterium]HNZ77322.1 ABC transporter ATP-binding protein [Bacilli bacterium]HOD60665.1 ABC transporter ATP-binding protein [Bacilli bacterium]HOE06289.1 ABC transporter ATP-binding protein [Bacilli bacterium]HOH60942.1 ABC transporter ATP-binding protein [Bacilli bacterium]
MVKSFIKYYRPHIKLFILDMICALTISFIDLLFPMVTNKVLREYIPNGAMRTIVIIGIVLLVFYGIRFILSYIIGYYGHIMGIRLETDMRTDLFKKLQTMDYQFFDDKKTGELMTNLTTHLHDVSEMSHHAPEDLFISFLMLVGSFIYLMFINVYLTIIIFIFLSFLIIYSISRRKKMMRGFRNARNAQGELNAEVESSISGIRLTKAFHNEDYEEKKFEKINKLYKSARTETFRQIGLFGSGNDFFINLANLALLVFGGYFVYKKWIDYIDLTTYFLYINFLIKPIARLTNSMEQLQQGFSGIEKFYNIMKIEPKIVSPENGIIKNDFIGNVDFIDVKFSYNQNDNQYVLSNFTLSIPAGKKVALVGETGVGKTTISKLIPRFYDVEEGQVKVDGIDVRDYNLFNLREAIGHVQQDVFIFYGTIKENILYGKPNATMEEIIEAAKKARIHDFIMTLENGYETITGERGIRLSGGQQQRIAIARLFLKNPKILILDEATSSLDNITETLIQKSIDDLAKGKTTIVIAHRLTTIKNADEIIVIGKNGILERGKHEELINNKGYYSSLYHSSITI